jgi:regulatory protein YycH of two-component signal transduction system YycFG
MFNHLLTGWRPTNICLKTLAAIFLIATFLSLPGCISKTKVYTADKTLVYGGNLYNLANVQRLGSRSEATLADGTKMNLAGVDKSGINALLKENDSIVVTSYIEMDDKEFIYKSARVKKYSDYSSMKKKQDSAMNNIGKFMGNKKSTQLKLK